jgi:hypothetical protein
VGNAAAGHIHMTQTLAEEIRVLEGLGLESLRAAWRDRYGEPPRLRAVDLLRRILAWKIQVDAAGGLDPELKAALRRGVAASRAPALTPGVKVAREWKGVRHDAEIVEGGVLYQGQTYDSLSAVARQITGVRWNGPRFFGLRLQEAA